MGNFNRGGSGSRFGGDRGGRPSFGGRGGDRGGRPSFPKKSWGGDRDSFNKEMHDAVCGECGKSCEVPFRPTAGKPVYCKECFAIRGGDDRAPRFPRRDFAPRDSFVAKPSFDSNKGNVELNKKIDELHVKIDRLSRVVDSLVSGPKKAETVAVASEVESITKKPSFKKGAKKIK